VLPFGHETKRFQLPGHLGRQLSREPLGGTSIPTRGQQKEPQSLAEGIGCSLLLMGTVGGLFGLAALLGISDRIELEFFEIQLNDTPGRLAWTAGCLAAVVIGILVLRARKRAA